MSGARQRPSDDQNRELLVFRHGKSDWSTDAATDFERPLAERGRRATKRMGRWMVEQKLLPDHIVSSPARRARQTAERFCRSAGLDASRITWNPTVYEADLTTLLDVLAACPGEHRRIMLVGHNPGLEEMVRYLAGDQGPGLDVDNPMPTAALAQLAMPARWDELGRGCARLLRLQHPRNLP